MKSIGIDIGRGTDYEVSDLEEKYVVFLKKCDISINHILPSLRIPTLITIIGTGVNVLNVGCRVNFRGQN